MAGPKITIAGLGLDISWKLFALSGCGLLLLSIVAIVVFALVAGIKVNGRNAEWFRRIYDQKHVEQVEEDRRFFPILKEQVEVEL